MEKTDVEAWVKGYIHAWTTNDENDIRALFTKDAHYYTHAFDPPWEGQDEIVEGWLGRQDIPGTWEFNYEILAVDGSLGVLRGTTHYEEYGKNYANLWLIWLNDSGHATAFTEYWMEPRPDE